MGHFHLDALKKNYPNTSFEFVVKNNYALSRFNLGYEHYQNKWYDLAIREYEPAAHIDPLLAYVYKNIGIIYTKFLFKEDNALVVWKKYIALNPSDSELPIIKNWVKSY